MVLAGMSIALHGPFNNQGGQMNQVQQNNFQGTGVGMQPNFQANNQFNQMGQNFLTPGLNQVGNFNQGSSFNQMQQFPGGNNFFLLKLIILHMLVFYNCALFLFIVHLFIYFFLNIFWHRFSARICRPRSYIIQIWRFLQTPTSTRF